MKNINEGIYNEVVNLNCYQRFVGVEDHDFVLDLGCSQGPFYFQNKDKNIDYVGIDASIHCIKDFYSNFPDGDYTLINAFIFATNSVKKFNWCFYSEPELEVNSITFPGLIKLLNRKIDFLKFDIEAYEKTFLVDNYDLFKNNVRKFAGEIHLGVGSVFPREHVYEMLEKLLSDDKISFKLYSVDGFDITDFFWTKKDYYTEIIINGSINHS
jgi:hypothetical protein